MIESWLRVVYIPFIWLVVIPFKWKEMAARRGSFTSTLLAMLLVLFQIYLSASLEWWLLFLLVTTAMHSDKKYLTPLLLCCLRYGRYDYIFLTLSGDLLYRLVPHDFIDKRGFTTYLERRSHCDHGIE